MTQPRRSVVGGVLATLLVAAGVAAYAAWLAASRPPAFHGTTYEPAAAAELRLSDTRGRPVTLASFRGAPVLLFFGYTRCPDLCPLTLDRLSRAVGELGERAGGARIVFVTVDPAHDTPDVLREYVSRFGPHVTALTGDSAALATAWQGYSVYVAPQESQPAGGAVHGHHGAQGAASPASGLAHSGVVYGIDRAGNLRVIITEGASAESMRDDIRTLARL